MSATRDPIHFIERVLVNPDDGKHFVLMPSQREFFRHAYKTDANGRLLYPEQGYATPKKGGKTTTNGIHVLTTTLLYGGRYAEAIVAANDEEQAISRVFTTIRRIVQCTPSLAREAKITESKITFPSTGATISAISSDYGSAAGANQNVASFDELWAFTRERSRRLFDELVPVPTRKVSLRFTTTYAGFENESELLLELYKRGIAQPEIAPDLHAGNGMLLYWTHDCVAPWQTVEWVEEMRRSLRPAQFRRMIRNEWTSTEDSFIDMAHWDACTDSSLTRTIVDRSTNAYAAIDASTKHDSTALVAVTFHKPTQRVKLLDHRIFVPSPNHPIDFRLVEDCVLEWRARYALQSVTYDPYQLAAVAQNLTKAGVKMVEFPQTVGNLTACGENLFSLISGGNLWLYPCPEMRAAISHAVAVESTRGWRISKEKRAHRIDVVVALAMATLAAVKAPRTGLIIATLAPPYSTPGKPLPTQMLYNFANNSWEPRHDRERTRIRVLRVPEALAPAARGP